MDFNSEKSITETYDQLYKVISSERFLKKQGLGNDLPFYICPFSPKLSVDMAEVIDRLINRMSNEGHEILKIDLYDLTIKIIKDRGIWERVIETEPNISKDELKELLQGILDTESYIIPAILEETTKREFEILFLSGVGEIYPYLRSHHVLNNLQSTFNDKPTVMFFPGDYTHSLESGASLDLFGSLIDDRYYRAFNIFDCK